MSRNIENELKTGKITKITYNGMQIQTFPPLYEVIFYMKDDKQKGVIEESTFRNLLQNFPKKIKKVSVYT